jgi:predicted phosphodiesterase
MPRVGLISDTHGLLRPEAVTFLRGSDYIVHAGDIGDANILRELNPLAPVTAVRGQCYNRSSSSRSGGEGVCCCGLGSEESCQSDR